MHKLNGVDEKFTIFAEHDFGNKTLSLFLVNRFYWPKVVGDGEVSIVFLFPFFGFRWGPTYWM